MTVLGKAKKYPDSAVMSHFACKDYKKLSEMDEARCLDCEFHLDCFPMDDETKALMEVFA
jgi:hypothetical protein